MELTWQMYAIVLPLVALAGFIDSVAGGGGLISLPAYLATGMPPHMAAGTNKLSAGLGTLIASIRFIIGNKVAWLVALLSVPMALLGSTLGANVQHMIDGSAVKIMMLCVIPVVAAVVLTKRDLVAKDRNLPTWATMAVSAAIGLVIGFYDGLVGPGTGTFLIILFTMILGMDTVKASGTAKLVNLASNVAAMVNYILRAEVLFALGIPAALCAMAGNYLGANMTIKKGTSFIRKMLLVVLVLLLAKMLYDVIPH